MDESLFSKARDLQALLRALDVSYNCLSQTTATSAAEINIKAQSKSAARAEIGAYCKEMVDVLRQGFVQACAKPDKDVRFQEQSICMDSMFTTIGISRTAWQPEDSSALIAFNKIFAAIYDHRLPGIEMFDQSWEARMPPTPCPENRMKTVHGRERKGPSFPA